MEKLKAFFASDWFVGLARIVVYAVVEVLASQAFRDWLELKISDGAAFAVAAVVIVQLRFALKKWLGEENVIARTI